MGRCSGPSAARASVSSGPSPSRRSLRATSSDPAVWSSLASSPPATFRHFSTIILPSPTCRQARFVRRSSTSSAAAAVLNVTEIASFAAVTRPGRSLSIMSFTLPAFCQVNCCIQTVAFPEPVSRGTTDATPRGTIRRLRTRRQSPPLRASAGPHIHSTTFPAASYVTRLMAAPPAPRTRSHALISSMSPSATLSRSREVRHQSLCPRCSTRTLGAFNRPSGRWLASTATEPAWGSRVHRS